MSWKSPLRMTVVAEPNPNGHIAHGPGETGLPIGDRHPGAFGFERANHIHEGVDLYCPHDTPVFAVEAGEVVAVIEFTGTKAEPPSPWWHDTQAVLVEGESGVVVYGEIATEAAVGMRFHVGDEVGRVRTVLTKDKGRPMSMLHLELHVAGTRDAYEWTRESGRPPSLLDPTPYLLETLPEARLVLRSETGTARGQYSLDLVERGASSRAGVIRHLPGGDWSWTAVLSARDGIPALLDDGVASSAEIARERQYAAFEEHDAKRFHRTPRTVAMLRTSLARLCDIADGGGRGAVDIDEAVAKAVQGADHEDAGAVVEQLRVVMPERATLPGYLELHGAVGLGELARSALARIEAIYPAD